MQRLSIARAMMHDPQVLFLDEPSAGLIRKHAYCFGKSFASTTKAAKPILLTTHNMEEADALCQRLAIIDHGRMIAVGTPTELKNSVPGGFLLRLRFARHSPELVSQLEALAGVREVRARDEADGEFAADLYADRGGSLVSEIAGIATTTAVELSDVNILEPSLENLFLHHTGRSLRE